MASSLLARLIRQGGGALLDLAVNRAFPAPPPAEAAAPPKKKTPLSGRLTGAAATRIATKSVPGAIVIGGALLAKTLYDRRHAGKDGKA
jgi:hypothetical protein